MGMVNGNKFLSRIMRMISENENDTPACMRTRMISKHGNGNNENKFLSWIYSTVSLYEMFLITGYHDLENLRQL